MNWLKCTTFCKWKIEQNARNCRKLLKIGNTILKKTNSKFGGNWGKLESFWKNLFWNISIFQNFVEFLNELSTRLNVSFCHLTKFQKFGFLCDKTVRRTNRNSCQFGNPVNAISEILSIPILLFVIFIISGYISVRLWPYNLCLVCGQNLNFKWRGRKKSPRAVH